jgi:hypothetical protein
MIRIVVYVFIYHNGMIDGPYDETFAIHTPRQVNDTVGSCSRADNFDRQVGLFLYIPIRPIIGVWMIVADVGIVVAQTMIWMDHPRRR